MTSIGARLSDSTSGSHRSPLLESWLSDSLLDAINRATVGRPRMVFGTPDVFVRLAPEPTDGFSAKRGDEQVKNTTALEIARTLSEPSRLSGPATAHEIDELAASAFDIAPNFAAPLEAVRHSAHAMLRCGAQYFQFMPLLVEAPPGIGKTTWAMQYAARSGLPALYLDAAAMTTTGALVSADSVWRNARLSEVVRFLAEARVANPIVILDEFDKLQDLSRNSRGDASEVMLPLLERSTAAAYYDHFLQWPVDLSFINWIMLCNDLNRIAKPVRDRCIVIRMSAPDASQMAEIAQREIARRELPEDLLVPILRAVRAGRLIELTCQLLPSIGTGLSETHKSRFAALLAAKEPVAPLLKLNASMLSVLYPWLSFHLLAKPPKFSPSLSRPGLVV